VDPFIGQLLIVPFNFAPTGWAFAAGQLMPISQNTALFSLIGSYYGGDGRTTFGLPNMQGNVPISSGQGSGLSLYDLGQTGGEAAVTLLITEIPNHNHVLQGANGRGVVSDAQNPNGNSIGPTTGAAAGTPFSSGAAPNQQLSYSAVSMAGQSQPHNNMRPFQALNYIIALQGIFPQRQ
jgi:microcystin-dependent protein